MLWDSLRTLFVMPSLKYDILFKIKNFKQIISFYTHTDFNIYKNQDQHVHTTEGVSSFADLCIPIESWVYHLCYVQDVFKYALGVSPQKSFNFIHVFSLFSNYLPLEKGGALHMNEQTWIHFNIKMIWNFSGFTKVLKIYFGLYKD